MIIFYLWRSSGGRLSETNHRRENSGVGFCYLFSTLGVVDCYVNMKDSMKTQFKATLIRFLVYTYMWVFYLDFFEIAR